MLHNLIKGDRNNEEAWYLLTICYPEQNKLKEIKDSLQSVSNTPLMKSSYGHILLRENNAAGAKQYFDEALKETRKKMPQC